MPTTSFCTGRIPAARLRAVAAKTSSRRAGARPRSSPSRAAAGASRWRSRLPKTTVLAVFAAAPPVSLDSHHTVVDTNTPGYAIDREAPTGVFVTSVGIERDGFRGDGAARPWLVVAISMANVTDTVAWGGIYMTRPPLP